MALIIAAFLWVGALAASSSAPCSSLDGPFCKEVNDRTAPLEPAPDLPESGNEDDPADRVVKLIKAIYRWKSYGFMEDVEVSIGDDSRVTLGITNDFEGDSDGPFGENSEAEFEFDADDDGVYMAKVQRIIAKFRAWKRAT